MIDANKKNQIIQQLIGYTIKQYQYRRNHLLKLFKWN